MKILLLLLALVLQLIVDVSVISSNEDCFHNKIDECPDLINKPFTFAAINGNNFSFLSGSFGHDEGCDPTEQYWTKILSPCLCRSSYDQPLFFSVPAYDTSSSDYFVLCLIGEARKKYFFQSEAEVYDLLMSKKIDSMPRSLINSLGNESDTSLSHCNNIYGNRTKDVMDQQTCMVSVEFHRDSDDVFMYAGPLLGSSMLDFNYNKNITKDDIITYCRTSLSDGRSSTTKDQCFSESTFDWVKLQCCCVTDPDFCSPKKITANKMGNKLMCLWSYHNNKEPINKTRPANELKFDRPDEQCYAHVHLENSDDNDFIFSVAFRKSECAAEITVTPENFCSSNLSVHDSIKIIRCCDDSHFCNRKLIPKFYNTTWCSRQHPMEQIAMGTSNETCTHFYDVRVQNFTKILIGFNAEIPDGQPRKTNQTSLDSSFLYDLNYVYAKIIKTDYEYCVEKGFPKYYNQKGEYRPMIQVVCETSQCDEHLLEYVPIDTPFECEHLSRQKFNASLEYEPTMNKTAGWICYVEINNGTIQAGELMDFTDHTECLLKDVLAGDGNFCCSNVFNTSRHNTTCTIEKLIINKKIAIQKENIQKGEIGKQYSENVCTIQSVPTNIPCAESDCFFSRLPEQSDDPHSIEPAGCKENAEEYVINDKDNTQMASISLACLSGEQNGCSMVKDVEGNERIVCCCEKQECDKLTRDLPKKVGKTVSSFRSN